MDVEKTIGFSLVQQANFDARMVELTGRLTELADIAAGMDERHDRQTAELRNDLRRATRLSVEEQRRERVRRHELDTKITQLASAQLVTEEKLQRLLDGLSRKNQACQGLPRRSEEAGFRFE